MTQTPMLRSLAMVNETAKKVMVRANLNKNGNKVSVADDGRHEEHFDTCCRHGCGRMAIWFSSATKGYCQVHWNDRVRHSRWANNAEKSGLCRSCGVQEIIDDHKTCEACRARKRGKQIRSRQNGLCWCGRKSTNGYITCESCRKNAQNLRKRNYEKGLCHCGRECVKGLKYCARCRKNQVEWQARKRKEAA